MPDDDALRPLSAEEIRDLRAMRSHYLFGRAVVLAICAIGAAAATLVVAANNGVSMLTTWHGR